MPLSITDLFCNPDAHPLALSMAMIRRFGVAYIDWLSETLRHELEKITKDCDPSVFAENFEKLQAVRVLHANDSFWKEWEVFENITHALTGNLPVFGFLQPPDPPQMAVAIDIANQVQRSTFHDDVTGYIAAACSHDGLWYLPKPLDVAQEAMEFYEQQRGMKPPRAEVKEALAQLDTGIGAKELQTDEIIGDQIDRVFEIRAALEMYNKRLAEQRH